MLGEVMSRLQEEWEVYVLKEGKTKMKAYIFLKNKKEETDKPM